MGKGQKKRRERNKQSHRTREELDPIKEKLMEGFEGGRAERERAEHERTERADVSSLLARAWRDISPRGRGDAPPILGETDPLARSPLKPKPHIRSGAIALPEPETEHASLTVTTKLVPK